MKTKSFSEVGIILFTFSFSFAYFMIGLAPGLTLEDAGELALAAYGWGIPHAPGYPVYILLSGLWSRGIQLVTDFSFIYSMNTFSAVTMALSAVFVYGSSRRLLQKVEAPYVDIIAVFSSLAYISCYSVYRQAIITEVYGLNSLFCAILVYLLIKKVLGDKSNPLIFGLVLGLAVSNHHISIIFAPFSLVFFDRSIYKPFFLLSLGFSLGLIPYLYLPLASVNDPILNWGNPDSLGRFWFQISRQQYAPRISRNWFVWIEQYREFFILVMNQLTPAFYFSAIAGLALLFRKLTLFCLFLGLLLFTGPMVAYLINFQMPLHSNFHYLNVKDLISVFYLNHLLICSILFSGFLGFLLSLVGKRLQAALLTVAFGFLIYQATTTYQQENKTRFSLAEKNLENFSKLCEKPKCIILVNWDPLSFPAMYLQQVEHKYSNLIFVDLELLHAPWYLGNLREWYPELTDKLTYQIDEHIEKGNIAISKRQFHLMDETYINLLNQLIAVGIADFDVFLAIVRDINPLPPGMRRDLVFQPATVAAKIKYKGTRALTPPQPDRFDFSGFQSEYYLTDRMTRGLARYYFTNLADSYTQAPDQITRIEPIVKEFISLDSAYKKTWQFLKSKKEHSL